ncbi:MAG TPA: MBL fold metallo-hydrolase [Nannocystaceae bacterium]|nr:MBL fold metallo-hydrolase [Nannocystaceae bacterium]
MCTATIPRTVPVELAPETFLVTNLAPAGGPFLPVNSVVIRGSEPIVVDTGAPIHRAHWREQVFSLVEPHDIRWIFLSHDDSDHTGGLADVLAAAPNATLVTNFFSTERLSLERELPMQRLMWREPGEHFDAGDRRLVLFRPPIFDAPTTRGLFDTKTGAMWAVDSFAAATPGAVHFAEDLPREMFDETFALLNSMLSPWHEWLDPVAYERHVDTVESLHPTVVASAHGPILGGHAIHDAFDRVRAMAGQPRRAGPGQARLDELLAAVR